ncbi:hypothetical protein ACFYRN_25050 [Streptomyces sp. NPDC005227]|uniref:hypothetical protein n=1 Tax=Streptomyces sp. NPDC005227 TaxID=3364707 RepID=UPI00367F3AAD
MTSTLAAAGIELGEYEQGVAAWLSSWDWSTVAVVISWVARACAAASGEAAPSVALPGRFDATPAEVDQHLRRILAEDTYLRYQQAIGGGAVTEAAQGARSWADDANVPGSPLSLDAVAGWHGAADHVDPAKGGGPYPAKLQCSRHDGFGPCPGAPGCTPQEPSKDTP